VQLRRDQLKRTQALFELGSVARGDVLKQQVTVSQAELDDIAAEQNIVVQRALLAAVVGLETGEPVEIDTTLTEVRIEADSVAVLRDAFEQRPELAEFRARLRAAQANLGAAQAGRYPSFGAGYQYTFRTPGFASSFNEIDNFDQSSGYLSLSWALFDGLFSKGRIREARAQKLQAQYALRQTELAVVVEVQQALQAATQASEQIQVARAGLDAAEEDLKLTQEKYNVGSATVIELIDSQVALTRAQVQYINAVADAHVAEMQLARARGQRF
jgi:outer membrane protein TolC